MTAAKKKSTTKKSSSAKKGAFAKAKPLTWKFYAVTIGIFLVATATIVVIGLFTSTVIARNTANERLDRIQAIYSSLQLDNSYQTEDVDIFGAKKLYDWDKSRSYSSTIKYLHGDSVSNTFNELDAKIREAGFVFIDEPYPGAVQRQYHYKSAEGEYIRLSVESKKYSDAIRNAAIMKQDISAAVDEAGKDIESGPAKVTIKVNLDDNNE
jgi:hypothetical protein